MQWVLDEGRFNVLLINSAFLHWSYGHSKSVVIFTWERRSAGFDDDTVRVVFGFEFQEAFFHLTNKDAAKASVGHLLDIDVLELGDL